MTRQITLGALITLLTFATDPALAQPPSKKTAGPSAKELATWIEQLGSRRFAEREAASRKLLALDEIPRQLDQATRSADAEVARRARIIVGRIKERNLDKRIRACLEPINKVGLDLVVERMTNRPTYPTDKRWKMLQDFADGLSASATRLGYAGFREPAAIWAKWPNLIDLSLRNDKRLQASAKAVNPSYADMDRAICLRSDRNLRPTSAFTSIVIVLGDIESLDFIDDSLVICIGRIGKIYHIDGSMILATESLDELDSGRNSLLQVGTLRKAQDTSGCCFVNHNGPRLPNTVSDQFSTTDQGPLQLLKLFDPANLGLNVKFENGQTRVTGLSVQSPFAKAGLRLGDELLSLDHKNWESYEQFRVALRKALANDSILLKARRDNHILNLRIQVEDEPANAME